jgi:hypothetical protein
MPQTVVVERAKAEDRKREAQEAESTPAHRSVDSLVGGNFPSRRLSSDRHFSEYANIRDLGNFCDIKRLVEMSASPNNAQVGNRFALVAQEFCSAIDSASNLVA